MQLDVGICQREQRIEVACNEWAQETAHDLSNVLIVLARELGGLISSSAAGAREHSRSSGICPPASAARTRSSVYECRVGRGGRSSEIARYPIRSTLRGARGAFRLRLAKRQPWVYRPPDVSSSSVRRHPDQAPVAVRKKLQVSPRIRQQSRIALRWAAATPNGWRIGEEGRGTRNSPHGENCASEHGENRTGPDARECSVKERAPSPPVAQAASRRHLRSPR